MQLHRRAGDNSGGSNDERLTYIDIRNCYICKVAQYLTSRELGSPACIHVCSSLLLVRCIMQ